jgi:hypothetical protein
MLIPAAEAAELVAMTEAELLEVARIFSIPCVPMANRTLFDPRDVAAWVESHRGFKPPDERAPQFYERPVLR